MAEGEILQPGEDDISLRGKVQKVAKEFAVYEDGAYAYQLQNEEIDRHYGLNRFNRRTAREDIPIAKIVQSDEELKLQHERYQQLQVLTAQAEEDERVAKQLLEQEQLQVESKKMAIELTDEEYAKDMQEKEKKQYKRHLEKKRLQNLKQEWEQIEKTQQQKTAEARLTIKPILESAEALHERLLGMSLDSGCPTSRVTQGGQFEDNGGDFSNFYHLPQNIDPAHRKILQDLQDEELARHLQEQELKRSKVKVDKLKMREIEEQDKRLAQIIEEQEQIQLKMAEQKWKQIKKARNAQGVSQRSVSLPFRSQEHNQRQYHSNSFMQSMENGSKLNNMQSHSLDSADNFISEEGFVIVPRLQSPTEHRSNSSRHISNDHSLSGSLHDREIQQNQQNVQKLTNSIPPGRHVNSAFMPASIHEMPDVERCLASQPSEGTHGRLYSDENYISDSLSLIGNYHGNEDSILHTRKIPESRHHMSTNIGSHHVGNDPSMMNIATAIDPTSSWIHADDTERKATVNNGSRCVPFHEERPVNTLYSTEEKQSITSPNILVQGKRREVGERSKKSQRLNPCAQGSKDKSNCKQQ